MTSDGEEDRKALGRQVGMFRGIATIAADAVSMVGGPGAILTAAAERAITKRRTEARDVLVDELTIGGTNLEPEIIEQVDESAAIMLRYLRAADEGTRTRNLRLLARAFRRQLDQKRANAESFQQTTASIGDLSDAELELLGGWLALGHDKSIFDYRESLGISREDGGDIHATAAALMRNGLVLPASAWDSMSFLLAPAALRLLVDLEAEDFKSGGNDHEA